MKFDPRNFDCDDIHFYLSLLECILLFFSSRDSIVTVPGLPISFEKKRIAKQLLQFSSRALTRSIV